jgi:hypothetical protein
MLVCIDQLYHFFTSHTLYELIETGSMDWSRFTLDVFEMQCEFVLRDLRYDCLYVSSRVVSAHWYLRHVPLSASKFEAERPVYQFFLESLADLFFRLEAHTRVPTSSALSADLERVLFCELSYVQSFGSSFSKIGMPWVDPVPILRRFVNWIDEFVIKGKIDGDPNRFRMAVLQPRARISVLFPLHILALRVATAVSHPASIVADLCLECGLDIDQFCQAAALLPLRCLSACVLERAEVFKDPPASFVEVAASVLSGFLWSRGFVMPLIAIVQFFFSVCRDKDAFLAHIAYVFGLFERVKRSIAAHIETLYIGFVSILLLNRSCIKNNEKEFVAETALSWLIGRPPRPVSSMYILRPYSITEGALGTAVAPYVKIDNGKVKLVDGSPAHIANIYLIASVLTEIHPDVLSAADGVLLNFPEWTELGVGDLDLAPGLTSRFLYATIYDIMHRMLTNPTFSIQYALNLFILLANASNGASYPQEIPVVVGDSILSLSGAISDNFQAFIRTPIVYRRGFPNTLIQIIAQFGSLGASALARSNIAFQRRVRDIDPKSLKASLVAKFAEKQANFDQHFRGDIGAGQCHVCRESFVSETDIMVYPAVAFESALSSYIYDVNEWNREPELLTFRQVYCCPHLIHLSCISPVCDHCNESRNCHIPQFSDDLHELQDDTVISLLRNFRSILLSGAHVRDIYAVLGDHILLTEVRFRSRPEILDLIETGALLRGLYVILLGLLHYDFAVDYGDGTATPLRLILRSSIGQILPNLPEISGKIEVDEFFGIVKSSLRGVSCHQLVAVLRQATLFAHFGMKIGIVESTNPDWDVFMSPEWLFEQYDISMTPFPDLPKPFAPVALPDDWICLVEPPYNLNIVDMSVRTGLDLVKGGVLAIEPGHGEDVPDLRRYVMREWSRAPILALSLAGIWATKVFFVSLEFNEVVAVEPIYLDRTGQPDYGFERSQYVTLNRENLARVFDDFVSGRMCGRVRTNI